MGVTCPEDPLRWWVGRKPPVDATRTAALRGISRDFHGPDAPQRIRVDPPTDLYHYCAARGIEVPPYYDAIAWNEKFISHRLPTNMSVAGADLTTPFWDVVGLEATSKAAKSTQDVKAQVTKTGDGRYVVAGNFAVTTDREGLADTVNALEGVGNGLGASATKAIAVNHLGAAPVKMEAYLPPLTHQYPGLTPAPNAVPTPGGALDSAQVYGFDGATQYAIPNAHTSATVPTVVPSVSQTIPAATVMPVAAPAMAYA
jgi:hypothetical protein